MYKKLNEKLEKSFMSINIMDETNRLLIYNFENATNIGVQLLCIDTDLHESIILSSDDKKGEDNNNENATGVATRTRTKTKKPNLYRVLLLNDDFTPMEFVIMILEKFFNKNRDQATQIMLHVHNNGVGECGVFTYEVAETKVTQVMDFARHNQHPLQCVMEKK